MSQQRLKRLQRLESRKPTVGPRVDAVEAAAALLWAIASFEAVRANKASLIPRYGPHREPSVHKHEALRSLDRIAARLMAPSPAA
jgi:hypothetical protein